MEQIDDFCRDNGISHSASSDSYYFTINGINYRVSNHTIAASNRGAFDPLTGEQRRMLYHSGDKDTVCITAGKTRIIQIYTDLKAGRQLDKRGNVIKQI